MSVKRSQQISIWIIAITLTIGTLGSFLVMALANDNAKIDQAQLAKQQAACNQLYVDYQTQIDVQADELSNRYFEAFSQYADRPAAFDKDSVKEVSTKDLKIGDGAEIKAGTEYSAYYIGWNPKGKVFDQSIDGDALKTPIAGGNLIEGWNEGVVGMKVGGVREITIPSDKAYGEVGQGEDIPANTPLKFIVMIIPKVTEPAFSEELIACLQNPQQ
ncbi:MAG TPA: FKBP-type peptidyl-prolyl cis-trans isomerase [Candidatus Saccharimonadales bacterium]|nr:FKBP-type peptidyl-prolyl cis-trans isomerase [Candidatus Saccharimonadales bacterium]